MLFSPLSTSVLPTRLLRWLWYSTVSLSFINSRLNVFHSLLLPPWSTIRYPEYYKLYSSYVFWKKSHYLFSCCLMYDEIPTLLLLQPDLNTSQYVCPPTVFILPTWPNFEIEKSLNPKKPICNGVTKQSSFTHYRQCALILNLPTWEQLEYAIFWLTFHQGFNFFFQAIGWDSRQWRDFL